MHKIPYVWHMKPLLLIRNDLFPESLHEKVKASLVAKDGNCDVRNLQRKDFFREDDAKVIQVKNVDNFKK